MDKINSVKDESFKDILVTSVFDEELGKRYFNAVKRNNLGYFLLLLISGIAFLIMGFFVAHISFVIAGFCFLLIIIMLIMHEITRSKCLKLLRNQETHYITSYDFTQDGFMVKSNLKDNVSKNYKYDDITKCYHYYDVMVLYIDQETYIIDCKKFDGEALASLLKAKGVKINKLI